EDGYDTLTNLRLNGWAVTFTLTRLDELRTRVGISVEYGLMLAVLGLTTMRAQAENEILSWIRALLALERGAGATPLPSLAALREERAAGAAEREGEPAGGEKEGEGSAGPEEEALEEETHGYHAEGAAPGERSTARLLFLLDGQESRRHRGEPG